MVLELWLTHEHEQTRSVCTAHPLFFSTQNFKTKESKLSKSLPSSHPTVT